MHVVSSVSVRRGSTCSTRSGAGGESKGCGAGGTHVDVGEEEKRLEAIMTTKTTIVSSKSGSIGRRGGAMLMMAVGSLALLGSERASWAFEMPPSGFRVHVDKLDGYSFFYPEDWIPVTTSGNDVFFRNPFNAEENLFVDISSPSSSSYATVKDLGSPEEEAEKIKSQFLEEFMSTRLGVKREAEVVKASSRVGRDGKEYYDVEVRVTSYASRNQLAVTQGEIDDAVELEFDRRYLTVLGTASNRLYALRLQTSEASYQQNPERLYSVLRSFTCKEVA